MMSGLLRVFQGEFFVRLGGQKIRPEKTPRKDEKFKNFSLTVFAEQNSSAVIFNFNHSYFEFIWNLGFVFWNLFFRIFIRN